MTITGSRDQDVTAEVIPVDAKKMDLTLFFLGDTAGIRRSV